MNRKTIFFFFSVQVIQVFFKRPYRLKHTQKTHSRFIYMRTYTLKCTKTHMHTLLTVFTLPLNSTFWLCFQHSVLSTFMPHRFRLVQISGDLRELEEAFRRGDRKHPVGSGSCSVLIKLLPVNEDLYTSHVTWHMLRIRKRYNFEIHLTTGLVTFECCILVHIGINWYLALM